MKNFVFILFLFFIAFVFSNFLFSEELKKIQMTKYYYIEKPMSDSSSQCFPILYEETIFGPSFVVTEFFNNWTDLVVLFNGKQIEGNNDIEQYKKKAYSVCTIETISPSETENPIDKKMFEDIDKRIAVFYYLGPDVEDAKHYCNRNSDKNSKITFEIFKN